MLLRGLVELLFPARCAACARPLALPLEPPAAPIARVLCARCDAALPRLPTDGCRLCQGPLSAAPGRCARCRRTPALSACLASVEFRGEVEDWIHRFKYPGRGLAALDPMPGLIARALAAEAARSLAAPRPGLVVPVPLHPRRLRARGFHVAGLLAREVARTANAPLAIRALRRVRDTPSQTGLSRRARTRNVAGAFRTPGPVPPVVWLVDDVVTTGATLVEAARTLRRGGARRVFAVCCARTPELR